MTKPIGDGVCHAPATLDDLHRVEGKAELIAGRIVPFTPSGDRPADVGLEMVISLREYAKQPPWSSVPFGKPKDRARVSRPVTVN